MADVNPYQAPQSSLNEPALQEYGEVKIFSIAGRLGRLRFLAYGLGFGLLMQVLATFIVDWISDGLVFAILAIALIIVVLVLIVVTVCLSVQRLHDFNASGWWAVLGFVPLVNLVFSLILLFVPGSEGVNRYAPPPPPNTLGLKLLAVLVSALYVISIGSMAVPIFMLAGS